MIKTVRRILVVVLALIMSLGILCACDNSDNYTKKKGVFYTLPQAYEQGLISLEDVKNICYHYYDGNSGGLGDDFVPIAKNPEVLDPNTAFDIKETWIFQDKDQDPKTKEEIDTEVTIVKYAGTYNGCVAVYLIGGGYAFPTAIKRIEIEGIVFNYPDYNEVRIWKAI